MIILFRTELKGLCKKTPLVFLRTLVYPFSGSLSEVTWCEIFTYMTTYAFSFLCFTECCLPGEITLSGPGSKCCFSSIWILGELVSPVSSFKCTFSLPACVHCSGSYPVAFSCCSSPNKDTSRISRNCLLSPNCAWHSSVYHGKSS